MRCLWFWADFGQPVSWSSGLCSCVDGELLGMSCMELVGPCVVLGFSVGMEAFDELLSINFLESGVPWSQGLDLSLLLPVIGLIFAVVSKLLLLYSTIDKISTLKMKSFSTMRVTQRGSQPYMEKRREEGGGS